MRSALFEGSTWHRRRGPVDNAFRYDVWTWLLDLDELDGLDRHLRLFAVDAPAPVSLHAEDHLIVDPREGWKRSVTTWLADRGVALEGGRIALQTSPRVFGYTFNPISLWWCWDADGDLAAVIAEVHNTYGGRHAYLLDLDERGRTTQEKELYVSPFYAVDGRYEMKLTAPDERFAVHIGYERDGERVFDATWSGERRPLSDRSLARLLLTVPWVTVKVTVLIHLQGVKLWLRGLEVLPRPHQPEGTAQ